MRVRDVKFQTAGATNKYLTSFASRDMGHFLSFGIAQNRRRVNFIGSTASKDADQIYHLSFHVDIIDGPNPFVFEQAGLLGGSFE